MNATWIKIFSIWIKSYESIFHLENQGIVEEYDAEHMRVTLLKEIMDICASEIETANENCVNEQKK